MMVVGVVGVDCMPPMDVVADPDDLGEDRDLALRMPLERERDDVPKPGGRAGMHVVRGH